MAAADARGRDACGHDAADAADAALGRAAAAEAAARAARRALTARTLQNPPKKMVPLISQIPSFIPYHYRVLQSFHRFHIV